MLRKSLIAALLLMASCTEIPLDSIQRLKALDPMTADLSMLRVEAELPKSLSVPTGGATLTLVAQPEDGAEIRHVAPLARPAASKAATRPGFHRLAFALSTSDAKALDQARRRINTLKSQGQDVPGSLSVSASACANGTVPDGPLLLSLWLDTGRGDPILVHKDLDLRKAIDQQGFPPVGICDQ